MRCWRAHGSRWAAFFLAAEQGVIYFYMNAPLSIDPLVNGGDITILRTFVFIVLAVLGPGKWSVDSIRASKG